MAAPSVAAFKQRFPEFATCPDPTVQIHLDDAATQCDEAAYAHLHELGVSYTAANALAQLPAGRKMQLVQKDGTTVYEARRAALARSAAIAVRVNMYPLPY